MSLVTKPDPKKKLIQAALLDGGLIALGVVAFLVTSNLTWLIGALVLGAILSTPLLLSAAREMKEQNDASR